MSDVDIQRETGAITAADLRALLEPRQGPCVSIYIETAAAANADQGRIRFKSALREVEQALKKQPEPGQQEAFLQPLRDLANDGDFWKGQTPALAIFYNADEFHMRRLPHPVGDLTVVAESFHVKPLIRLVQHAARFQLLCVSSKQVDLYEGRYQHLEKVELHPDVPRDMGEALGEPAHVTKQKKATFVPDDSDNRDRQLRRYFRRLDEAITEHHSKPAAVPLMLAALPEYHGFFHEASHNPLLVPQGIKRDPFKEIDAKELAQLAWEAVQEVRQEKVKKLQDSFREAAANQQGTDDINEVARQAVFGKVATLMIQDDHRVGGEVDPGTGELTFRAIGDPKTDDVVDDIAEIVLRKSGEVLVLPADEMPTDKGVAAILRYTT